MLFIALLAIAAQADGKTMAQDDWHHVQIVSVGSPVAGDPAHYLTAETGDLDGDGRADLTYLKLACDGGTLRQAYYSVKSPRDAASGLPTGKRQHGSVVISKEWGKASPQLAKMKAGYDVKTVKAARAAPAGDWTPIALGNADGLCAATAAAVKTITKTTSNIQNN